jgi:hypothetical protein
MPCDGRERLMKVDSSVEPILYRLLVSHGLMVNRFQAIAN